jgi:hypothetical protein
MSFEAQFERLRIFFRHQKQKSKEENKKEEEEDK